MTAEIPLIEDHPTDLALTFRAWQKQNLVDQVRGVKDGAQPPDFLFAARACAQRKIEHRPKLAMLYLMNSAARTQAIPVVVRTSSQEECGMVKSYKLGVNS
jgi:hypothetical protein